MIGYLYAPVIYQHSPNPNDSGFNHTCLTPERKYRVRACPRPFSGCKVSERLPWNRFAGAAAAAASSPQCGIHCPEQVGERKAGAQGGRCLPTSRSSSASLTAHLPSLSVYAPCSQPSLPRLMPRALALLRAHPEFPPALLCRDPPGSQVVLSLLLSLRI